MRGVMSSARASTCLQGLLNDLYSRDISKKVLAGWMARSRQGKFPGGPPLYGLMRDPNDHGHLIIDLETAPHGQAGL